MSLLTLADLMREDLTVEALCPRCSGRVIVPMQVKWAGFRHTYLPTAHCTRCGVGFGWHTEQNPVSQPINRADANRVNVWYADRVLEAPTPTIVEE